MKTFVTSFKKSTVTFILSIAGTITIVVASGAFNAVNAQVNNGNTNSKTIKNTAPAACNDSLKTAGTKSKPIIYNLDAPPAGTGQKVNESTNLSTNTSITTGNEATIPVIYNLIGVPPDKNDPDYFAKYQIFVKNNPGYFAVSPANKGIAIPATDSNKVVAPATDIKISK